MAIITDEIKEFVAKRWAYVATISPEGIPNIGPKASFRVIDDEHIGFAESTGKRTFENLKKNPNIAVAVADKERRQGYRFVGKAEVISEGPVWESVKEEYAKMGRKPPFAWVRIAVDEIYDLGDAKRGTKLA